MRFKAKDKVILKYLVAGIPKGTVGVIHHITNGNIGVEFDKSYGSTHDLDGEIRNNNGYYVDEKDLELYAEPKAKLEFEAGKSINSYVRKILRTETSTTRKKLLKSWQNCILPENVKDTVEEAITVVLRKDLFDKWGLNSHFEKGITNSILIYGPSGTGKTMISESIAAVLGKDILKLDSGAIQSNIPGQTERNIAEAFSTAKAKDNILLLDECDSLLYNRNSVGAIMASEINSLLTEIERFDGVVLLTTNRYYKLDEALQRRIVAKVELPLPTRKARNEIWKKLIPSKMPIEKLDYQELSNPEISGGDIKNVILLAARKAIAKNCEKVTMEHFRCALLSVVQSKKDYSDNLREEVEISQGKIIR